VGEVEGYQLDASGKQINVYAFVRRRSRSTDLADALLEFRWH